MEILQFNGLEITFFVIVFISISLWKAVFVQSKTTPYPYNVGFPIFSVLQWISVAIGMIAVFGGWGGIIALLVAMTLGSSVAGLSLGWLWLKLAEDHYFLPTAFFTVTVWTVFGIAIALAFFH